MRADLRFKQDDVIGGYVMKKIRWGIAGPGVIANKFAKAVLNIDSCELVAVASRSLERGADFAKKYGIENVFGSYEEMAASSLVDAVYIATPHPFHKSCAEIFLNAGKHVLCEKPICVNAYQANRLYECAKKNKVFLMEAMWTRFLPAVKELEKVIRDGIIGDILEISADFCYRITEADDPKMFEGKMAGGSLLDVGVYGLHFISLFLGNAPESIKTQSEVRGGVDMHTGVLLKFKNGEIAHVSSAIDVEKPASAYIYGTDGYVFIPDFYGAKEFFIFKGNEKLRVSKPSLGDGFEEEILEASLCIASGKTESDRLPLSETIAILRQMDTIRAEIGLKYPLEGEPV